MVCVPERKDPVEPQCGSSFVEAMACCDCDDSNIGNGKGGCLLTAHLVGETHTTSDPWGQSLSHSCKVAHTLAYLMSCALGELPYSSLIQWKSKITVSCSRLSIMWI